MANRALAAKHDRAKRQNIALAQAEYSKPCYLTAKAQVPAYDPAMVKRCDAVTKARKVVYRNATPKTLVQSGLGMVGSWNDVGKSVLIKRR